MTGSDIKKIINKQINRPGRLHGFPRSFFL